MEVTLRKTSRFTEATRRLLTGRFIVRSKNAKAFQTIADNQKQLEAFFNLAGGDLHINETLGVAYVSGNVEDDDSSQIRFGRKVTLKAAETLALVFIRKQRVEYFSSANAEAESPLLDIEKLKTAMSLVIKTDTDRKFQKVFSDTIDRFKELQFLFGNEEESLVISPVVDIALPADEIAVTLTAAEKFFASESCGVAL